MRWDLTMTEEDTVVIYEWMVNDLLLMPVIFLQGAPADQSVSLEDVPFLVWGISDLAVGRIYSALYHFEQRLLPGSAKHGKLWRKSILLWSALCRLYQCDPDTALSHITSAEQEGFTDTESEFTLAKGMALRLKGEYEAAVSVLKPLTLDRYPSHPKVRTQAIALLVESLYAGDLGCADRSHIEWLWRYDELHEHMIGVTQAALYRFALRDPDSAEVTAELLESLDQIPAFQRPVITMLLDDILPRPLAGVQEATRSPGWYWESDHTHLPPGRSDLQR